MEKAPKDWGKSLRQLIPEDQGFIVVCRWGKGAWTKIKSNYYKRMRSLKKRFNCTELQRGVVFFPVKEWAIPEIDKETWKERLRDLMEFYGEVTFYGGEMHIFEAQYMGYHEATIRELRRRGPKVMRKPEEKKEGN